MPDCAHISKAFQTLKQIARNDILSKSNDTTESIRHVSGRFGVQALAAVHFGGKMIKDTTQQTKQSEIEETGIEQKTGNNPEQDVMEPQNDLPPEQEELDELQIKIRGYSEKKWNTIQYVCGTALGFLCGALVTYFASLESIGMYGTIAALLIAMFVPRIAEKRVKRSIQRGRVTMMIALAVWIAVTALIMALQGVPFFV